MTSHRKPVIAANWKMNLNPQEASILVHKLGQSIKAHRTVEVVLGPTMLVLQPLSLQIDKRKFKLAAQNAYQKDSGAFTGEISFAQLRGLADYCIIGHSERRIYFSESLETVRDKVAASVRNGITPILCIGETDQERIEGETKRVIHDQLTTALANLTSEEVARLVVAYEPVWAISTFGGKVAKPDDMQPVLRQIRDIVRDIYGEDAAESIRVLYGGSVKSDTVSAYLQLPDCDGALVGGASLIADEFAGIVSKAYGLTHE